VSVLQILLSFRLGGGSMLNVDGIFGPRTRAAVVSFQSQFRDLKPDGIVGRLTWLRLFEDTGLKIIDAVDVTDPDLMDTEAADLIDAGGSPIITGGMSNGIVDVANRVQQAAQTSGSVVLLRFFGHGAAGTMAFSDGTGVIRWQETVGKKTTKHVRYIDERVELSSLTPETLPKVQFALGRLTPVFSEFGSVELHGCKVARDVAGRRLLERLADLWRVPVTAGRTTQLAGGKSTFRFEGPIYTAIPGNRSLRSWSQHIASLAPQVLLG
jgi:hypothetical protein